MNNNNTVKVSILAKVLMLSERRVQQLCKSGVLEKQSGGQYPLIVNIQRYIKYVSNSVSSSESDIDINIELKRQKMRLLTAQADKEEVDAELAKKKTLLAEDVFRVLVGVFSEIKNKLLSIPDRCEPYLIGETDSIKIKQIIYAEIKDKLYSITDGIAETLDRLLDYDSSDQKND
ncbi:hypothetical protein L3V82_11885 [Thiotrichales bacterium 19S3-7]|nr:hypothetical protein [Thiotrichales bacterium 19S3-7]MCF6802794.1 hypothetical protein [Thiotrichales bacterium 19S3-11]